MPYFFSESITKEKNAGNKARKDVENIFSLRGYKKVNYVRSLEKSKIKQKIGNLGDPRLKQSLVMEPWNADLDFLPFQNNVKKTLIIETADACFLKTCTYRCKLVPIIKAKEASSLDG